MQSRSARGGGASRSREIDRRGGVLGRARQGGYPIASVRSIARAETTAIPQPHDEPQPPHDASDHLAWLEAESIHILREVAAECERPALMFSGGKDSIVMLHLARAAFWPGRLPFPVLHIDTGHNFPEVIAFRDAMLARFGERLIVRTVEDAIARGIAHDAPGDSPSRNLAQIPTLLDAVAEFRFDALFGGARRDEERARAKERVFSFRDSLGRWDPRRQRPELWRLYNGRTRRSTVAGDAGEHIRAFPLSNWTEIDVWRYIEANGIEVPSIYFSHERDTVLRAGCICPVSGFFPPRAGEAVTRRRVRFRTVGDMTCTAGIESGASTVAAVIAETLASDISERGARLDDTFSEAAMEDRKREGYF